MAGIKTAVVMTVGTATLAAFIGGGGYGSLIVRGLALDDTRTILAGAAPAAVMALAFHALFELPGPADDPARPAPALRCGSARLTDAAPARSAPARARRAPGSAPVTRTAAR